MSVETAASFRVTNDNLRAWLARLHADVDAQFVLNPDYLSGLHAIVLTAARCRRSLTPEHFPDAELEREIREYRGNMEELAKVLPSVLGRLLGEKARLQNALGQVSAAKAWALASKETL